MTLSGIILPIINASGCGVFAAAVTQTVMALPACCLPIAPATTAFVAITHLAPASRRRLLDDSLLFDLDFTIATNAPLDATLAALNSPSFVSFFAMAFINVTGLTALQVGPVICTDCSLEVASPPSSATSAVAVAVGVTVGLMLLSYRVRDRDVQRRQEQEALRWRKTGLKDWEERSMRKVEPVMPAERKL